MNSFSRYPFRNYYFVVMPELHTLDFGGPVQAIHALDELGLAKISLKFIGPTRHTKFFEGLEITNISPLPSRLEENSLLIFSGSKWHDNLYHDSVSREVCEWLDQQIKVVPDLEVASVCTGAFLLGEAGLLDYRQCTTHHQLTGNLAARYPKAFVQKDRLFVRDSPITTSAGVSSGVDMILDIVRDRYGDLAALAIARDLVLYIRRSSEDHQLSPWLETRNHLNARVHQIQDAIISEPQRDWRIKEFALMVSLSERQVTRLFRKHTGISIKSFHTEVRLELTKKFLRNPNMTLEQIADRVGFKYAQNLRRAWNEHYGGSPSVWRRGRQPAELPPKIWLNLM